MCAMLNLTPSEIAQGVAIIAALLAALFAFLSGTTKPPLTTIDMTLTRKSRYTVIAAYVALFAATVGLVHLSASHWGFIVSWFKSWLKI
jgi:2-methylcitrate dehydratase PrpD